MGSPKKRIRYQYDAVGNRKALIDHDGGRFTYSFDSVNRITQVLNPQGDRTTYSYDDGGRRTAKKLSNGTRASFTYDGANRLTRLANLKSDGTTISSFGYKYDKVGNRTSVLEVDGSRVTWSYDATYQLTGEHRTGTSAYRDTYTYDPTGNRLLKIHDGARTTSAYDAANQLTYSQDASGRTTYTFDADGNQQVVREPSGNRTTYSWDYENRMTLVRLPSGVRNTMAYEPEGLRVKLEESTGVKKFVWDEQNYLGETDGANDTQAVYTNEPRRYGNLVSQRRGSTSHWFHFDAIGSTRELTTAAQVVSDTRLYDAWGLAIAATGSAALFLMYLGQPGYYCDPDVISLYLRARMYSPRSARWLSCDPDFTTSPTASSADINTYRYVVNRPSFRRDPSGLQPNEEVLERLQIYCGCCNYRLDQLREPPNPVIPRLLSGPSGPGSGRCVLEVSCMPVCPGPDTNIPGYTWPREIDPEGRARYRIRVCISCAVAYNSIDTVVIHELQHAIRFCRRGGIPQVCARCIAEESISYERSCNERFPADGDRAERCRLCGIVASCGHLDNGTCRPRGAPRDCQLEDLGIALYPGCRFEFGRGIVCDFEDG